LAIEISDLPPLAAILLDIQPLIRGTLVHLLDLLWRCGHV